MLTLRSNQDAITNALNQRQLSYSYVRLLPKDTGIRPIVNLRRKGPGGLSVNQILQGAFQILNYEKVYANAVRSQNNQILLGQR